MKKKFQLVLFVVATLFVVPAFADDVPKQTSGDVITPEDASKMREQISALTAALDGKPPPPKATEKKTMADVADKALDKGIELFTGVVGTVGDALKKIAPDVWRIMIKKQYADAACYIGVPLFMMIVFHMIGKRGKIWFRQIADRTGRHDDETACQTWDVLRAVAMTFVGVWLAIALGYSLQLLINPEYYAVKDLLQLVTSSGNCQ